MGAKVDKVFKYYARVQNNRLVNGLMHILVRNDMETKDDALDEYYSHWGGTEGSGGPDDNAQDSHPFNNSIPGNPDRTGHLKAIGDYDSFLYFVTVGANLGSHETNGTKLAGTHTGSDNVATLVTSGLVHRGVEGQIVKNTTDGCQGVITANTGTTVFCSGGLSGGTDNDWDNGDTYQICNNPEAQPWHESVPSHLKCQSFVRYQLLGRHNNVDGHSGNNYLHYGLPVNEYGCTAAGQGAATIPVDQALISGSERLIVNTGRFTPTSGTTNFGSNLAGLVANNTFFSPVSNIEIYGYHPAPLYDTSSAEQFTAGDTHYALTNHDTTFFNLVVSLELFGYTNADTSTVTSFFRNKVNIFFQPFGETTSIQFSQTPDTPITS